MLFRAPVKTLGIFLAMIACSSGIMAMEKGGSAAPFARPATPQMEKKVDWDSILKTFKQDVADAAKKAKEANSSLGQPGGQEAQLAAEATERLKAAQRLQTQFPNAKYEDLAKQRDNLNNDKASDKMSEWATLDTIITNLLNDSKKLKGSHKATDTGLQTAIAKTYTNSRRPTGDSSSSDPRRATGARVQ